MYDRCFLIRRGYYGRGSEPCTTSRSFWDKYCINDKGVLSLWGVIVTHLVTQTDQTMTELEIDMNMKIGEWSVIQESGKELELVYGPGYTGLSNLGNR